MCTFLMLCVHLACLVCPHKSVDCGYQDSVSYEGFSQHYCIKRIIDLSFNFTQGHSQRFLYTCSTLWLHKMKVLPFSAIYLLRSNTSSMRIHCVNNRD